jgi:hypothetical protein
MPILSTLGGMSVRGFSPANSGAPGAPSGSMPSTFDLLIVAGGGGGGDGKTGSNFGGSGGAGGYRMLSGIANGGAGSYYIEIGAGGASETGGSGSTFNGGTLSEQASTGGGYGATNSICCGWNGDHGGSGGGGCYNWPTNQTPGDGNDGWYDPVEGYGGATYGTPGTWGGGTGGGGGSSAAGGVSAFYLAGAGTSNSISGSATTYATGGGAGTGAGDANTGEGGEGGYPTGDSGGSGVVIIKYSSSGLNAPTWDSTTPPTDLSAGGYYIYKWTGDGTMVWD